MKKPVRFITKLLLLSVISILTSPILFAQPYTHVEEKESYYAEMILTGYPERDSSFAKRLSLSNEVISNSDLILRGIIEGKKLQIIDAVIFQIIDLNVSHVFRGSSTYVDSIIQIKRLVEDKEGFAIKDGKIEKINYYHSYEPGLFKGLEYIIFCKQSQGELSFYVNHRMSFLNRYTENKNIWIGLCGHFYTSLERLQNHLSQFPDIRLMNVVEED